MKYRFQNFFPLIALLLMLLLPNLPGYAEEEESLSPAISILQEEVVLHKSAVKGKTVSFSVSDFEELLSFSGIERITVETLPSLTEGCLFLDKTQVNKGQVIPKRKIGQLKFVPSSASVGESEFQFGVEGSEEYSLSCVISLLDERNFAPTAQLSPSSRKEAVTFQNITGYMTLSALDPENDSLRYEVVSYPSKGILSLNAESGKAAYTPVRDYVGKDYFTYRAWDEYGNCSEDIKVSVSVEKNDTAPVYADLIGKEEQYAAIRLTQLGIVSPDYEGGSPVFLPDKAVSRLDFLVMAMKAAGYSLSTNGKATQYKDDSEIPNAYRGYVCAAVSLGFVPSDEESFRPNATITRAEAAEILCAVIPQEEPKVVPVFADGEAIPSDAMDAVNALSSIGALQTDEKGKLSPTSPLTRGDCATLLCVTMEANG